MIKAYIQGDPRKWDLGKPALLFAVQEVPQASMGCSLFELVYGYQPWELLDIISDGWQEPDPIEWWPLRQAIELKEQLDQVCQIARDSMGRAQGHQKEYYDKKAREWTFQTGDWVLVILPDNGNKLLSWWQGLFMITRRIDSINYEAE